ncbi:MAG: RnfABCDGE type electron transport complex subunit D, partial [Lachnospiraceae bacterium]|nr:RnfABCDGE type electron transport complex subunit D [Lachnospiraceae bacterium]
FLVILLSVLAAVHSEYLYDVNAHKKNTVKDGSAVVTGLLLALSLPPEAPLYLPILGSAFAILVVKCFFGGLGKNFLNPALTARCFLLISFGTAMTNFSVDGVSSATPLAALNAGDTVNVAKIYLGTTNGVIGGSALALLIGGLYLWAAGGITLEIPVSCIVAFTLFMGIFGEGGFAPAYLIAQICGGGLLMGAFFMATDPVTSPVTSRGHILYGAIVGILGALFRVYGSSADSFSYAIIISNMLVPFIDKLPIPKPLGYKDGEYKEREFPKAAVNLTVITLVAGLALSGVYAMTKTKIEEQELADNLASYQEVCPDAVSFKTDDDLDAAVEALGEDIYDSSFGKTYVNTVVVGYDESGEIAGYVISVTSGDGYDGDITLSVGLTTDGTVIKLAFTTLNETAGMGMRVDEDAFKGQFEGVNTDAFVLNKSGDSTEENEIDTVSGASTSSGAVVNAVNTALAFFATYIG